MGRSLRKGLGETFFLLNKSIAYSHGIQFLQIEPLWQGSFDSVLFQVSNKANEFKNRVIFMIQSFH